MRNPVHNYELLCLFPNEQENKKEEIIIKFKSLGLHQLEVTKLNPEKLEMSYLKIAGLDTNNYLLINLKLTPEKVRQIEQLFKQSSIQYLLINKDREKKPKVKIPNRTAQGDNFNKEE